MSRGALRLSRQIADEEREDRYAQLRDMQSTVNACTGLMFVVFAIGTFIALRDFNHYLAAADEPAKFTFVPDVSIWCFFPLIGGMTLSWYLTLFVWSLFGSTAKEYRAWARDHALSNFRGRLVAGNLQRFFFWAAWFLALPIGIATMLALNMHTAFAPDQLRICGYAFRPCEAHGYSEIRRETAVAGTYGGGNHEAAHFERDPYLVLDFANGERWTSFQSGDLHHATDGDLAAFLFNKTGLAAGNARLEKDIPPLSPR